MNTFTPTSVSSEPTSVARSFWDLLRTSWKWIAPAVVLAIVVGACLLLYHELHKYSWKTIQDSFHAIPASWLAACLVLTTVNYLVLVGYDVLAVRAIGHPLPLARVALASFTGFATSYNIGAVLGGTPVRIRLYASWGMTPLEIVRLMAMIGTTFWFGVFALAGVMFVVDPFPVPEALKIGITNVRPIGVFLLLITAVLLALPIVRREPIRWGSHVMPIPTLGTIVMQLLVAALDLVVAAGCLYVLLPDAVPLSFPQFLGVYLLAVVAVIFTHVPGGVGVFEVVILEFAGTDAKDAVFASVLAFRVIYYLIPMALTLILLGIHEWRMNRERFPMIWQRVFSVFRRKR